MGFRILDARNCGSAARMVMLGWSDRQTPETDLTSRADPRRRRNPNLSPLPRTAASLAHPANVAHYQCAAGCSLSHPARRTRPRASRSSLDVEGLAGARTGTACRSAGLESDRLARDTCARIALKAPDSSPKSADGTFRRRGWAHPSRQKFHRFRAAGRPCRMFVQEVLRRLRRPAPGIDEGTSDAWRCGANGREFVNA